MQPSGTIDLHMHSSASDGALSPAGLMRFASDRGVTTAALTDHDTVLGNREAAAAASALDMRFVPGIESSCSWGGKCIHVVGLAIDPGDPGILSVTENLKKVRIRRGEEMAARLADAHVAGDIYGMAVKKAGGRRDLSRTHFAQALIEAGAVKNVQQAFDRYLGEGRPGFMPAGWPPLAEAVAEIQKAGGFAVLAHPGRYSFRDDWMLDALVEAFRNEGGVGIEVISGSQPAAFTGRCLAWAKKLGLFASAGSDFHNPAGARPRPGTQGWVPAGVPTVLDLLGIPASS